MKKVRDVKKFYAELTRKLKEDSKEFVSEEEKRIFEKFKKRAKEDYAGVG